MQTLAEAYLHELNAEAVSTRKCLERIPETTYEFKPHPKSMPMGYLVLLVAEIPAWITHMIDEKVIDLAAYKQFQPANTSDLVNHFEENLKGAQKSLETVSAETLNEMFSLKSSGQVLFSSPIGETISSTLNHWVHHRGQLTVYMRLNDILVPSVYGPSADERQY